MLPTSMLLEIARLRNEERLAAAERHHALVRPPLTARLLSLVRRAPAEGPTINDSHPDVARVA